MVDEAKAALSSDSSAESLLGQGTELAEGNILYAVEITQRMPDQLWAAQKDGHGIASSSTELEAEVQLYKANRNALSFGLGKSQSEIQQRVLGEAILPEGSSRITETIRASS